MPKRRRRIIAVLRDFQVEINRLRRLDSSNQLKFAAGLGRKSPDLSKPQLHFLTEAIFFKAFQAYENFVRDVFILYCLGLQPRSGTKVESFLKAKNFTHAEEMIQSSMRFLDWTDPEIMIERATLYLKDGIPFRMPYIMYLDEFRDLRRIRNHIAHNSKESLDKYLIVLRKHYTVIPLLIPSPGEFLLLRDRLTPTKYKLLVFMDFMLKISSDLT